MAVSGVKSNVRGVGEASACAPLPFALIILKNETGFCVSHDPEVSSLDFAKGRGFGDPHRSFRESGDLLVSCDSFWPVDARKGALNHCG